MLSKFERSAAILAARCRLEAGATSEIGTVPEQPARVLDLEFLHLCCDFLGLARFPTLSPLGERVARPGVFFSQGGPGEGVRQDRVVSD